VSTALAPAVARRFWQKVCTGPVPEHRPELGPCWLWLAGRSTRGYGVFTIAGRQWLVHRLVYILLVGPIPQGLTLDHLCRVRHCCNPRHTEPCTRGENALRGDGPAAANARKTRCPRGHPYDLVSGGRRRCLACKRDRYHQRKATTP
jgi:hypothetical protein